jgi:phosphomannomutase
MLKINPSIFKGYDIRGIYPEEIDEDAVYKISSAFCEYLNRKKHFGPVILGQDARLSSPVLAESFSRGVLDQGRDIIDIGMCSTPLFYFAVNSSRAAGGAMITASHNPKEYNGLKLVRENGWPVYKEDGLPEISVLADSGIGRKISAGKITKKDFSSGYLDFLMKYAKIERPLKIVADASNGSAGPILEKFLDAAGIKAEKLFFEPDGNFPNHSPNPLLAEALKPAAAKVRETGADLGFVADADGDRIIFIDEKGESVNSNILYAFLLDNFLAKGDLALIAASASKIIEDVAAKKGARFERIMVGHANFKMAMRREKARFGGEPSGHFYFRDFYYSDSALLALVYVLSLVSRKKETFSEILKPYQKYFNSGELNFEIADPNETIERLKNEFADGRKYFIDGLTVEYDDWWFNIRASQTEPVVRITVEADNKELLEEKTKLILSFVK